MFPPIVTLRWVTSRSCASKSAAPPPLGATEGGGVTNLRFLFETRIERFLEGRPSTPIPLDSGGGDGRFLGDEGSGISKADFTTSTTFFAGVASGGIGAESSRLANLLSGTAR